MEIAVPGVRAHVSGSDADRSRLRRLGCVGATWTAALSLAFLFLGAGSLVDSAAAGQRVHTTTLFWMAAAALLAGVSAWVVPALSSNDQAVVEAGLRAGLMAQVLALGPVQRSRERSGRIVSTATDGVERAGVYRGTFLAPMAASMSVPIVVLIVVAATIDPMAAVLLAMAVPLVPLALGLFSRAFRSVSTRYRHSARRLAAKFLDAIQGLTTLEAVNAGPAMGRELARCAEDLRRHVMGLLAGNQIVLLIVDTLFSLLFLTVAAAVALHQFGEGVITGGEAFALVLISTLLLEPLDRVGQFFYIGMGGRAAVKEIDAFRAETPRVTDTEGVTAPTGAGHTGVRFDAVAFDHDGGKPLLRDVSFQIAPGEKVALVGASGQGKTTVGALLQGELRPDAGRILIDGHDLTEVPLEWVRNRMTTVSQHSYLFTGTLRENLTIADPEAGDERLWEALDAAGLGATVRSWTDGLDTAVGERGLSLSGGQLQRVAIARALLKDAPILVLDEPTSQVDLGTEAELLANLRRLGEGRTVLTISHRAATIGDADRVLTLDAGVLR